MKLGQQGRSMIVRTATLALLVITGGCQLIGGIEKAHYDPDWDSDSTTDDSTTSSGDGDATGDGDPSGDGDSGDGDPSGDGDSGDGDRGSPIADLKDVWFGADSCSTELDIAQDALDACLYRVSCDPDQPSFSLSTCLTFNVLQAYSVENCSVRAGSCEDIYLCLRRRPAEEPNRAECGGTVDNFSGPCVGSCSGSCYGECDGDADAINGVACDGICTGICNGSCSVEAKSWTCNEQWTLNCESGATSYDCSGYNGSCLESPADGEIGAGGCVPNAGDIDCSTIDDQDNHCSGNTIYSCLNGQAFGFDCDASCVEGQSGAYCSLTSDTCSDYSTYECSGDTLGFCNSDGVYSEHDCGANGLSCTNSSCLADGCETNVCQERCVDENTVEFCVGGATIQVDCTSYGFSGCRDDGTDYYGNTLASCSWDKSDRAQDTCSSAKDGWCDEYLVDSDENVICEPGTDGTDCGDTCPSARNGVCDVIYGTCEPGTDNYDCGDSCTWSGDGTCDEPGYCPPGTDTTDCLPYLGSD